MKANIASIWFDIGPRQTPKGLVGPALTMKPSSPFYDAEEWLHEGEVRPLTAYTDFSYADFIKAMEKETGLVIIEFGTHYTLQVRAELPKRVTIEEAKLKLEMFVRHHFDAYKPCNRA